MEFSLMAELFQQLEKTSGRLEKTSIISDFISDTPVDLMPTVLLFLRGRVFPLWSEKELGMGDKLMIKVLSNITGASEIHVEDKIREKGDIGFAAEELLVNKTQTTLFTEELTVEKVHSNLTKLAELSGKKSRERKIGYISELLSMTKPLESRYVVRLVLEELRLGVGEGTVRDAIASVFNVDASLLERARSLRCDLGEVAKIARQEGDEGLRRVSMKPGRPIEVMLAQKAESIEDVLGKITPAAFEIKYDGARLQIHKMGDNIELFTRRLEKVTKQFPEIVSAARDNIKASTAIVEGELVAIQSKVDRNPRPFQDLSKRIRRKYRINDLVEQIPVEVNLFDIVLYEERELLGERFDDRRKLLEKIINKTDSFRLSEYLVTSNLKEADEFYQKAIKMGHEGVMVKNPGAPYQPGSRVGYMYKIKQVMETLDLAVVGATWGEGRRAHWMSSFLLALRDEDTGEFLSVGRMATGLTDKQFKEVTSLLKPLVVVESGKEIGIKPKVVLEVAYDEIQKSQTYESGYALRFPRLVRIRYDKGIKDVNTLSRLKDLITSH
ncbi:MAG: DNA ligase [Candidatus Altiarchaeales archaeon ex4484_2]|nr:MAG: DNA ligase [Candidatus Altiarchaeales archaeon ex4484_2]